MTTILLVDDSRVTRELIKVYLIAKDVRLIEAADGQDALTRVRFDRPDLVLADLRMPRLDGVGLCEAMRADSTTRSIPVVILTGHRDAESARRCLAAGAREVLTKPIQPQPLIAAVARCLGGPSTASAGSP
jgi:two-component system chemotaxis sensor kinase CheA